MIQHNRLPIDTSTLADELRILHEATGKLLECYMLYSKNHDRLSEFHRKGVEQMIMTLYQQIKDVELAPLPCQHLSLVCQMLQRGIVWLYASVDTVEHSAVLLPEEYLTDLFARMRTEPYIPVVRPQNKKGRRNGR